MKKEFFAVFQLSKTEIFEVNYYTLGNNLHPYFSTTSAIFERGKRDYCRCGQCQKFVLPKYDDAYYFYKKWDYMHTKDLTEKQYTEMVNDMEILFEKYNNIYSEVRCFSFDEIKELSKRTPKKHKKIRNAA